jgi:hypothetical protein
MCGLLATSLAGGAATAADAHSRPGWRQGASAVVSSDAASSRESDSGWARPARPGSQTGDRANRCGVPNSVHTRENQRFAGQDANFGTPHP